VGGRDISFVDGSIRRVFSFVALIFFLSTPSLSQDVVHLKYEKTIPLSEHDVFFKSVPPLVVDQKGTIFAVDNREHAIIKLKDDGREALRIGKRGQGPGELLNPSLVTLTSDRVCVLDGNGISMFGTDGGFLNRFRVFSAVSSMESFQHGLLLAKSGHSKFIHQFDFSGKLIRDFGNKIDIDYSGFSPWSPMLAEFILNTGKLFYAGDHTHFINKLFGDWSVYDEAGLLIKKEKLADPRWVRDLEREIYKKKPSHTELERMGIIPVFLDLALLDGHFYALVKKEQLSECPGDILRYSADDGRLEAFFILSGGPDVFYQSFVIHRDTQGLKFILSGPDSNTHEIRMDIFRPDFE
jgi:hypothetical protein